MGRALAFLLSLLLALAPSSALAWGQIGHSTVAEIAQRRLTPRAAREVERLLGRGHSLASVSSWADGAAHTDAFRQTAPWHYVDVPLATDIDPAATTCAQMGSSDCIIDALVRLRHQLQCDPSQAKRAEALQFIVHFIGDLHQPLHTVDEEAGGNGIHVRTVFDGPTCGNACEHGFANLHSVWDSNLIERGYYDWGSLVDHLEQDFLATPELAADRARRLPGEWASETHLIARQIWKPDGATLDRAYYDAAKPIIDRQLSRAGLRLADYLNDAFATRNCSR